MRLLPAGADDVGGLPAGAKSESYRHRHRRRDEREPVPVRELSADSQGDPSRGGDRRREGGTQMNGDSVSRRLFLTTAVAAGGGLLIRDWLESELSVVTAATPGPAEVPLNAWIRISPDDVVTLISSQSEMGQGVMTTLPAVLAEELGADWSRVKVESSPTAPPYRNPRINWQFTGNSESTTGFFELLRTMGASAREMLIVAAAKRWSVKAD